jgi:hypothetical protein
LLPGTFFGVFAIFWSFITAIRHVQSRRKWPLNGRNGRSARNLTVGYKSTVTMPCLCLPSRRLRQAPVESYVKLAFTLLGIVVETVSGFDFHHIPGFDKDDASLFGCDSNGEHVHNHGAHHSNHNASDSSVQTEFFFSYNNRQHITMYSGNCSLIFSFTFCGVENLLYFFNLTSNKLAIFKINQRHLKINLFDLFILDKRYKTHI